MAISALSEGKRHALVTGTSSGIGQAIASHLLEEGWRVTGLDIAPPTLQHSSFTPVHVDLRDGALTSAATSALALVHAAGVLRIGRLGELQEADGQMMWQLHVEAASRLANTLVPAMASSGFGRVVLVR